MTSRLGQLSGRGRAPVASQNVSDGFRLWEGNQGPLMKLQVWQWRGLIGREKTSVLKGRLGRRKRANQAMNAKLQAGVHQGAGGPGAGREELLRAEENQWLVAQ